MQRILAFIAILLLIPVLAVVAFVILVVDGRPVFFLQTRVAKDRGRFTLIKFRTMKDGSLTRFGALLRSTGIDELPQLINVVVGTMSLVGPRPLTPGDVERLGWSLPEFDPRWSVLPGITGPAQLLGVCDKHETMRADLDYVKHRTLAVDMAILARSILVPVIGKRTN